MEQVPRQESTREFREQAVWLVLEQEVTISEAARRLTMSGRTLERWVCRARQGQPAMLGESRRPVTELEAEVSRLKRDLAETRMERDILKKPPRTLRRRSCPVRADEDAGSPLSAESVVPGAGGVSTRVLCLGHPPPLKTHPGECATGSGDPGRPMCAPGRPMGRNGCKLNCARTDFPAGGGRIKRLRKKLGLRCQQVRRFMTTTDSTHALPVAENVVAQAFVATRPNEIWVTDITYVPTTAGWLYRAGIKDRFTCEVVGHAMRARMTTALVSQALGAAVWAKRPRSGLIHRSDRGLPYCAQAYQEQLRQCGMTASMSRRGSCYDNAPMESFWGTLKNELVHHRRFETREQAWREISEYIESFYNRQRRHFRLGNRSPVAFAQQWARQQRAA